MSGRFLILAVLALLSFAADPAAACNEAVCAPPVTYCDLIGACNCTREEGKECTCCESCMKCLNEMGQFFAECCSCVEGLCPERNVTDIVMEDSTAFDFSKPDPEIWNVWVEGDFSYWETTNTTEDCTVTFLSQCTSLNKCHEHCRTMGAGSGRWFSEGCCECAGPECLDYGIDEPHCLGCTDEDDEEVDLVSMSEWDQMSDLEQEEYLQELKDHLKSRS